MTVLNRNWTVEITEHHVRVLDDDGDPMVSFRLYGGEDAEMDAVAIANARLIAAAPRAVPVLVDLTERAEQLNEETLEDDTPPFSPGLIANARAAIAQAIGG